MEWSRDEYVFTAKMAAKAERFEDATFYIEQVLATLAPGEGLTEEERNLHSTAYKNLIDARRKSWRILSTFEQSERGPGKAARAELIQRYRVKVKGELDDICNGVLRLLNDCLLPTASDPESNVFFLKMKADYHRYLAEFKIGDERTDAASETRAAYMAAEDIAKTILPPTHPIKLALALNYAIFIADIMKSRFEAHTVAKRAFDEAMVELDRLDGNVSKDSATALQMLNDYIKLLEPKKQIDGPSRIKKAPKKGAKVGASELPTILETEESDGSDKSA